MSISVGEQLPAVSFLEAGPSGPQTVAGAEMFSGGKVVLFGVPGAFTGTCSNAHVPSFVRSADALREKGIGAIACVSVNDPFVMKAWGEATGATEAGIRMLSDASGAFTRAIGMAFDRPEAGLYGRSRRFAMVVESGTVAVLNVEESAGTCTVSSGEQILEAL